MSVCEDCGKEARFCIPQDAGADLIVCEDCRWEREKRELAGYKKALGF